MNEGQIEFDQFWAHYPRHVGKLAAMKAYQRARKLATAEQLLAGVQAYCQHLPREMCFVAHASSWLNAGRWLDEYEKPAMTAHRPSGGYEWLQECQRLHGGACQMSKSRHDQRLETERPGPAGSR